MKLKGIELKGKYTIEYSSDSFKVFDENNNKIYYEDSDGFWAKIEFDKYNNAIYYKDSDGYWSKKEYDENNNRIYYENSNDYILDNRPKSVKQYTVKELEKLLGKKIEIISEKE